MNSLSLYKYTDTELKQLLKTLTLIVDTREKENKHITEYLDKKNIPHIRQALTYGDYSYMLPASEEFGINRDMYFTDDIVVERKSNLEELSGNLTQNRVQFENEFLRKPNRCDTTLLIEDGSIEDILNHKYRTKLSEKAFIASLMTFEQRFGIRTAFVNTSYSGQYIYGKFYYHLRELLK